MRKKKNKHTQKYIHLDNSGSSPLHKMLNLITSAKNLFSNKATFIRFQGLGPDITGGH